ncbi:MAG: hypothetical protein RI885_1117 [Actinomycetota bacterium]|jgi:glycosyltransferase involved in cell wall biosynthesis
MASRPGRRAVLVNQSYAMQRVTGQQRYATEISRRLLASSGFAAITPTGSWAGSALRVWAWLQFVLPFVSRRSRLLSMTSRAPLVHPRQIIVVHDLFVLTNPEWFSAKYVMTHAPLLRAQLRRAGAVVAVSEPVAEQVRARFHGPVVVAPNAPSEVFSLPAAPADHDVLATRSLVAGGYLLAVGSLDPRKNLATLAAAYGLLSPAERRALPLVVVGGGNAIFRDESLAWPEGTVNAGFVSDDELRVLYRGARSVVFVSLAEGFGLPIVEAVASGATHLILSDIPVFRWICGDGADYVDPKRADMIAAAFRSERRRGIASEPDPLRFTWDDSAAVIRRLIAPDDQEAREQ